MIKAQISSCQRHLVRYSPPSISPRTVVRDVSRAPNWRTHTDDAISTARAKQLIHEIAAANFKYLRMLGGEPLLRSDLFEILREVPPETFSKVILGTNGLLLDEHADAVNRSCITNLTVSLDGVGDNNDRLRGIKGYFEKILHNLEFIIGKAHQDREYRDQVSRERHRRLDPTLSRAGL